MNVREVRKKIKSVTNVRKITRAMQLVSAIKMKKAQARASEALPYQTNIDLIIRKISANLDKQYSSLLSSVASEQSKELVIVISSNKGLCGSFNFNLFRFLVKTAKWEMQEFVTIGKKASLLIPRFGGKVVADFSSAQPINGVSTVFQFALTNFLSGKYRSVYLVYNHFISALDTQTVQEKLMPFKYQFGQSPIKEKPVEYLVEPNPDQIIDSLLRSYLEEKIRNAVIQSEAGEHSARMVAMKNATENANDVIYNLTMLRNKIRQERITNELLDMVTAKESVENS